MDLTTILVIAIVGLVVIGVVIVMLNRAWGDFPGRVGPPAQGPSPLVQPVRSPAAAAPDTGAGERDPFADEEERSLAEDEWRPAGAPAEGLVPVTHPLVKRAVEQALDRGGSAYATYFLRDGDQVFLAAYRIADPGERANAVRVFQSLNDGDLTDVHFSELFALIQRLGR